MLIVFIDYDSIALCEGRVYVALELEELRHDVRVCLLNEAIERHVVDYVAC